MSSNYGPDVLNPRTDVKPQVLETLRDPIAALMFNRRSIPYDRVRVDAGDIPYSALTVNAGDIPYSALTIADGQIPRAKLAAPAYAIARRSTNQVINSGAITAISFDTEASDNAGMFTPTSTVITISSTAGAGLYLAIAQVTWAAGATTRLTAGIRHVASGLVVAQEEQATTATELASQSMSVILPLAVNDQLDLVVFQSNTGAATRTVTASTFAPRLHVVKLGAS